MNWIAMDDVCTLLNMGRETVIDYASPGRNRWAAGILRLVRDPSRRGHPAIGVETWSLLEFMALRRVPRNERNSQPQTKRTRRTRPGRCPRCEILTDDGGLCEFCQAEQQGQPYWRARNLPARPGSTFLVYAHTEIIDDAHLAV